MKYIFLLLIPFLSFSQQDVPSEYCITDNDFAKKETSKNSKELLRRLHIKDGEKIIQGAEAFLLLWKKMPKYKFLYNFFKLPIIFNLFSFGYEIIAFFLYLKNKKQLKN